MLILSVLVPHKQGRRASDLRLRTAARDSAWNPQLAARLSTRCQSPPWIPSRDYDTPVGRLSEHREWSLGVQREAARTNAQSAKAATSWCARRNARGSLRARSESTAGQRSGYSGSLGLFPST